MVDVPPSLARLAIEVEGWLEFGCPDHALRKVELLLRTPGARPCGLMLQIRAYADLRRFDEALRSLHEARQFEHDPEWADVTEAYCRKRMDDLPGAVACMERLIKRDRLSAIGHFNLACYLALSGERDRPLQELSIACGLDDDFRQLLKSETDLVSLHDAPEFLELLPPEQPLEE